MSLRELVGLALSRLGTSRLRAVLTMLGIIIGVASIVALVAVAQGATSGITSRIAGLGTNLLTVTPGSTTQGFVRTAAGTATTLTMDDATALAKVQGVAALAPQVQSQAIVVAGSQNTTTSVVGTTSAYPSVRAYTMWQGSFLTDLSVSAALRVAVLGATTADDLGLGAQSIGHDVLVGGIPFRVIGIFQPKGSAVGNQDDEVVIPITTAQRYFVAGTNVRAIGISVASSDLIQLTKARLTSVLEQRHGTSGTNDDFTIGDQSQLLETFSSVTGTLSLLLGGIAAISLIVGGIGIMNIMLVSVRERTREIGIRKAIGARRRDILLQFLVEALVISVLGGLIGIVLGVAVSALIGTLAGWGFVFNPLTVVVAVGFSLVVGVVFGVWPARQAARLDPIAALHYE
ncbi:MAG TPA: ABC transporter permease [Candidatus Limnocylindrales bacterium]